MSVHFEIELWREFQTFSITFRYSRESAGAGIPGGFCNDCNIPFRAGGEAYRHFTSKLHRWDWWFSQSTVYRVIHHVRSNLLMI